MRLVKMKGRLVDMSALQKQSNQAMPNPSNNHVMSAHTFGRMNNHAHAARHHIQQPTQRRGNN